MIDPNSTSDPRQTRFTTFWTRIASVAAPLLLIVITTLAYSPILWNGFVGLDDQKTVYENWNLTHPSAENFYAFWTGPQNDLYTPLTYSLFAAIAIFAKVKPRGGYSPAVPFHAWPFHAASLILHVLAVVVVYRLLRRLIGTGWPPAVGALLFALHPVQVETVAWVTATNGLLCTLLALTAILLYLNAISVDPDANRRTIRWSYFALASEVFILAMLAKPLAVVVPVLAMIAWWVANPSQRFEMTRPIANPLSGTQRRSAATISMRWIAGLPWELATWLLLAMPFAIIARLSQPIPRWWLVVPVRLRPFVAGDALAFYICKVLWPSTLTVDYDRSPATIVAQGWAQFTWILPMVALAGLMMLNRRGGARPAVAGAMWFIAGLIPVLGFTPFAFQKMSTVADRYLYLPMFGVALAAAWGLDRFARWNAGRARGSARRANAAMLLACLAVLTALAVRTWLQTRYWHDKQSLFQHSRQIIGREPGVREGS